MTVSNTGHLLGSEVVQVMTAIRSATMWLNAQVYLTTLNASVPLPLLQLVDFTRVDDLAVGQQQQVLLTLTPGSLAVSSAMHRCHGHLTRHLFILVTECLSVTVFAFW